MICRAPKLGLENRHKIGQKGDHSYFYIATGVFPSDYKSCEIITKVVLKLKPLGFLDHKSVQRNFSLSEIVALR
jgi:hypothetical protein